MDRRPNSHDDSGGFLSSNLARAGEHFAAKDREDEDNVTRWATRIGRALSLAAFIGLAWYFGHQLKWW
ncbi:MAG TPA: hypothetical protein PKW21_14855 [Rhabdaerophilum sp.]|nr:hypothetical protein [Rhabdaerophilum sp.]